MTRVIWFLWEAIIVASAVLINHGILGAITGNAAMACN
jgi:hypothetical protein